MKVTVGVHGRFHGFDLARELHARSHLARLVTTYPRFAVRRFLPATVPLATVPWIEAARRAKQRFRMGWPTDTTIATAFGRFAARHLPEESDVLVGWSSATLEAIPVARARGMKVVIERGSTHIVHQAEVMSSLRTRFGGVGGLPEAGIIEREVAEYEAADAIAVPSGFVAETFVRQGMAREKLFINPYGVDLSLFSPAEQKPAGGKLRILFVGRVGIRKGVPDLLEAFAPLAGQAELHLIGPIEAGMGEMLRQLPMENVYLRGPLPMRQLPDEYRAADVFCLPSYEEGLPLVVLQAMASGLPVVTTFESGVTDLLEAGKDAWVIKAGETEALAEALRDAISNRDRRVERGAAARGKLGEDMGWGAYGQRAISFYRELMER